MTYLLDTNIFITAKNTMPMDFWPTFWSKFADLLRSGSVFTSVKVKEEIEKGKDELVEWLHNIAPSSFFLPLDEDIMNEYAKTQAIARGNATYTEAARHAFANSPDAFLVATAAAKSMVLVTNEKSDPFCKKRVKIPDVCNALSVRYCDLNAMLIEMGVQI